MHNPELLYSEFVSVRVTIKETEKVRCSSIDKLSRVCVFFSLSVTFVAAAN